MTATALVAALLSTALVAVLGVVPSTAAAQGVGAPDRIGAAAPSASRHAPSREASVAGVRLRDARGLQVTADTPRPAALAPSGNGRGATLAIVGGAAFLGGLLIGDDVGTAIAVGGLFVGVYGLWLWLK